MFLFLKALTITDPHRFSGKRVPPLEQHVFQAYKRTLINVIRHNGAIGIDLDQIRARETTRGLIITMMLFYRDEIMIRYYTRTRLRAGGNFSRHVCVRRTRRRHRGTRCAHRVKKARRRKKKKLRSR